MDKCPYCDSEDTEEFEDSSGFYCYGCMSNVMQEDVQQ